MLGRGLADLIPVGGDAAGGSSRNFDLGPGQVTPVATLHPNPRQPRTRFDEAALDELADSIRANGILQPILVRPRTAGGFEIVAGERRYRAALRAGLREVPVVVRTLTDEETLALALIENLIREDIGPMETARAFQRLMEDYGWTQEEMGKRVGKSRSAITNSLRLLALPEPIQRSLEQGELTEGHARSLVGDERQRHESGFREQQMNAWRQIVAKGLSVRDTEKIMKGIRADHQEALSPTAPGGDKRTGADGADWRAIQDRLRTALGTQVRLVGSEERGRIEIEFFSADELDDLITKMERRAPAAPGETPPAPRPKANAISGMLSSRRSLV